MHELGRQCRQSVDMVLGPTVLDRYISTLEKAYLVQALSECGHEFLTVIERSAAQNSDHRHRLLRSRRRRPRRRRAAKQPDELAAPHSITSSAVASNCGGSSRPSILAV